MAKSESNRALSILGGTYDPVHVGHLRVALQLRDLGFSEVLMLPNSVPPHRPQPVASAEHRYAMLKIATESLAGIEVSDIEIRSQALSYTLTTVSQLRECYPELPITWVVGTDAWLGMHNWHKPEDILDNVNVLVVYRPGEHPISTGWHQQQMATRQCPAERLLQQKAGSIGFIEWPGLDISASYLRQAILQGDNIDYLIPESVQNYIQQNQLYK